MFQENDSSWVLNKEVVAELMKINGQTRGVAFKTDIDFVLKEKGEEGVRKVEEKLLEAGLEIKYKDIETMKFYPMGLRAISLLAIKEAFGFTKEDIKRMGLVAPKISLIIKFFLQYFMSPQKVFKEVPKMWSRHHTVGEIEPIKFDEKNKESIIRIKNLKSHPIFCCFLTGYFSTIVKMMERTEKIKICEETKCPFRGDEYHEYIIKW